MSSKIEISIATVWLDENSIVHVKFKPNSIHTLETMKEQLTATNSLTNNKEQNNVMIDARNLTKPTKPARDFVRGKEMALTHKNIAVLIDNPVGKIIANFCIGLFSPPFQVKIFNNKQSAHNWLLKK